MSGATGSRSRIETPMTVDGLTCTVIRSARRTKAVEITRDARILVRVPFSTSDQSAAQFVRTYRQWIEDHLAKRHPFEPEPTDEEIAEWKRLAQSYIPDRVAHFSRIMGLVPTGVRINTAHRRFGSCGTKNALNFSCRLMKYPPEAIDYVVVHELAHLQHRNHGPLFYALIERYMPDYRKRERLLNGERQYDHMD